MERIYCGSALKKKQSAMFMVAITVLGMAAMFALYWIAEVTA